jgi:mRNA interferase MazF
MKTFDIWLANLNPNKGKEPGKVRPVIIVQSPLLNDFHPTVVVCPLTSQCIENVDVLRHDVKEKFLDVKSQILVDQIRAIDKKRLIEYLGAMNKEQGKALKEKIRIVLDLE